METWRFTSGFWCSYPSSHVFPMFFIILPWFSSFSPCISIWAAHHLHGITCQGLAVLLHIWVRRLGGWGTHLRFTQGMGVMGWSFPPFRSRETYHGPMGLWGTSFGFSSYGTWPIYRCFTHNKWLQEGSIAKHIDEWSLIQTLITWI